MSDHIETKKPRRVRFAPAAIAAGAVGALLLTVSLSGTLSGFTAGINNTNDTASSGALTMSESTTATTPVVCTSTDGQTLSSTTAAQCTTINKYGNATALTPGGTGPTTSVIIKNTGTVTANTFTMGPGACTYTAAGTPAGTATDICTQMSVVVTAGAGATPTPVFSGTLAQFAVATSSSNPKITMPQATVAAGASVQFNFTVSLSSSATNADQNLTASQPIQFNFAS
jgi:hypothetical protein